MTTHDAPVNSVPAPALRSFAERFRGRLIGPEDEGYDEARSIWNGAIDRRPGLLARCSDADDVVGAVRFARDHDLFDIPADYKLDVTVTPPPLEASIDGAAYYPAPPFQSGGVGRFYVTPTKGDPAASLTEALARHPLASVDPLDRPYSWIVFAYARTGRPEEARRLLREYEAVVPAGLRAADPVRWWAVGAVAETEHRDADALAAWHAGYEQTGVCGVCGLFEIAGTMERMGQPDSARMAYERLVTHPSVQSAVQYESFALAPSYKRLGELYEAKGDRKKAADYYGRFVDLYQHADPELQHAVREVRERLGRLAQEPGT